MNLLAVILLLLGQLAASAALVWEPAGQVQVVFAELPAVVRQDIRNDGQQAVLQQVRLRLVQLTSSIAAPVPGWEQQKQVTIPAGETLRTVVDLNLPKVSHPTRFQIIWNNEAGKILGSTDVVGCPQDLFQPLRTISHRQPIGLLGSASSMSALFVKHGAQVRELQTAEDLKSFEGSVVLAAFASQPKSEQEEFGRLAAQHAKDRGVKIVWLVEPDNLSLSPAPAVCIMAHQLGTLVVSSGLKLSELERNPLAQLRLVWLVELALASEENRLVILHRLMKL